MTNTSTTTAEIAPIQSDNLINQARTQGQQAHDSGSTQLLGVGSSWPSYHGHDFDSSPANHNAVHLAVNNLASGISGLSIPSISPQLAIQTDFRHSTGRLLGTSEQTSGPSTSSTQSVDEVLGLICYDCRDRPTFSHRYLYNKHRKKHDRHNRCVATNCGQAFGFPRDLDRHVASKHPELLANSRKLHFCAHQNCDRAVNGRLGGFPRKDTLVRHLRTHKTPHPDQQTETSSFSTTNGSPPGNSSTENL